MEEHERRIEGLSTMRIKNLRIENFRSFGRFGMKNLGRINLIVGANNSGKTTILEGISILIPSGDVSSIWAALVRRGEDFWVERDQAVAVSSRQVEIRRLFHGHEIEVGAFFRLSGDTEIGGLEMTAKVEEYRPAQPELFEPEPPAPESSDEFLPPLTLSLSWSRGSSKDSNLAIPISRRGGISLDSIRRTSRSIAAAGFPLRLVTASSLTAEAVSSLFEDIVLTPEEDLVTNALALIEPMIERIASAGSDRIRSSTRYPSRGGIFVRLKGVKDRIPIGSMGDGIWRMLGLALNVVHSREGILLVDEIDTGLHHTVMQEMWKFLYSASRRYNVQVFATTHSRDCYESLAVICNDPESEDGDVTMQRVERGREEAVAYSEGAIMAAAKHDIEVR
jgi:predicted ATPase